MEIQQIKSYMKENKITYEELSKRSNLSISTIKKIFSGISQYPRIDTMKNIENALGLNVEFTEEEKKLGIGNHNTKLSPEEWDWLELYSLLKEKSSPETINAVKTLILTFIEEK